MKQFSLVIPPDAISQRLDLFISQQAGVGSRSRALKLFELDLVRVNSRPAKPSRLLKPQDLVEYSLPENPEPAQLQSLDLKLKILYEDKDVLVVNKPPGLVVHPAAGHAQDTLVNALLHHTQELSMKFGETRPGIVHRLDRDTSGLLVVAKNDFAHTNLTEQFKVRSVGRVYEALVHGKLLPQKGTWKSFLARHPTDRKKFASLRDLKRQIIRDPRASLASGKWAVTHWERIMPSQAFFAHYLQQRADLAFVRIRLETGRTHQIRVHFSEAGYPLVADPLYGNPKKDKGLDIQRLCLHARILEFTHPRSQQRLSFSVDWPEEDPFAAKVLPIS